MKKTYSGSWKPKNLHKYKGDPNKIHYRSLWERNAFRHLDDASWVKWWNSEENDGQLPIRSSIGNRP